jgi:hypothetical protein
MLTTRHGTTGVEYAPYDSEHIAPVSDVVTRLSPLYSVLFPPNKYQLPPEYNA